MIPHDDALRDRLARNLAAHELLPVPPGAEKRAAVAIVVDHAVTLGSSAAVHAGEGHGRLQPWI